MNLPTNMINDGSYITIQTEDDGLVKKWNRLFSIVKTFTPEKKDRLINYLMDISRSGVDGINLVFDKDSKTILHWACCYAHESVVEAILKSTAANQNQVDIKTKDKGETALMIISKGLNDFIPSQNIISKLLEYGSNINCTDDDGNTCLHHAVYNASKHNSFNHGIVSILKDYHCDINILNNNNQKAVDLLKNVTNENRTQVLRLLYLLEVRNSEEVFENMIGNTTKKFSREKNKQSYEMIDAKDHLKIIVRGDIVNRKNFKTLKYAPLPATLTCVTDNLMRNNIWSYGKDVYPISICNSDGVVITDDDLKINVSIALKENKSDPWKVLKIESHNLYKRDKEGAYYLKSLIFHSTEYGSRCRLTFSIESKKGNEVNFDKLVWKFKILESDQDLEEVEYVQCDSCQKWWIIPPELESNVKNLNKWACHMTSEQSSWKAYNLDVCPCDEDNTNRKRMKIDSTDDLKIQSLLSPTKLANLNTNPPSSPATLNTNPPSSPATLNTNPPSSNATLSTIPPPSDATLNAIPPSSPANLYTNQTPSSPANLNTIPPANVDHLKYRGLILLERKQLVEERNKLMQLISSLYETRKTDVLDAFQQYQLEQAKEEYNLLSSKLKSLL